MRHKKTRLQESETFPGYAEVREIGSGGFASVYRATELDTGRPVALKVLKVSTRLPHVREAFEREVRALGAVSSHPHIVTLYRTLTTPDGRPALVLELCTESCADRVRRAPMPPAEAVATGIKIAGALETAHRAGLLHRDMKPQNILVTSYGEPALADFGVAALQASAQATEGVFGFTTLHAPPEILEGHRLSPATDVYGLASTIYQLITGRAPFAAFEGEAPASVILRILRDPVQPLRPDSVPLPLSDALEAALAKDPAKRPATAAEFAATLRSIQMACGWAPTDYPIWDGRAGAGVGGSGKAEAEGPAAEAEGPGPAPATEPPVPPAAAPGTIPVTSPGVVAPATGRRNVVAPVTKAAGGYVPPPPPDAAAVPVESDLAGEAGPATPITPAPAPAPARKVSQGAAGGGRPVFEAPPATPYGEDDPYERTLTSAGLGTLPSPSPPAPALKPSLPWVVIGAASALAVAIAVLVCVLTGVF